MRNIIRETRLGKIQGSIDLDSGIEQYIRVPYAKPPLGEYRWKPPIPVQPWNGIWDANIKFGIPFQKKGYFGNKEYDKLPQSEDVLYLNIWTNGNGKKKPVYVWFHGGAFQGGYAYDPTFKGKSFAGQDIVVVSAEYRCGVFGFLAHQELSKESEKNISGNYGCMDQLAVLQWVHNNIADYEGDPEQVTIGGQSAGGDSVYVLMHMKQAEGLFQRAIIESGIIMGAKVTLSEAEKAGEKLMNQMKCNSIEELRKKDGKELLEKSFDLEKNVAAQGVFPCIDQIYIKENEHEYEADVPLLIGNNGKEGIMFFSEMSVEGYQKYLRLQFGKQAEEIFKKYPAETDEKSLRNCIDIESVTWEIQTEKYLNKRQKQVKSDTFVYSFTHKSIELDGKILEPNHSGELWYVFDSLEYAEWDVSEKDRELAEAMNSFWAGFIKTGKPVGENLPEWNSFSESDPVRMIFEQKIYADKVPYNKEMWKLLYGEE